MGARTHATAAGRARVVCASALRHVLGAEHLQRTAGNRATAALIQRSAEPALTPLTEEFSAQEERWIDDVWHDEAMQILLQAYGELPTPVLARVREVMIGGKPSPQTEGVTRNQAGDGEVDIEIADSTYSITQMVDDPDGAWREATAEEEFKTTLVHELFHYVENTTKDVDPEKVVTPETMKAYLFEPRLVGLPAFTFGWFDAGGGADHLDNVSTGLTSPYHGTPAAQAKADGAYEASPDGRGLEEDLATTIGMYLGGPATRGHLAKHFPKRYDLVDRYFGTLQQMVARRG